MTTDIRNLTASQSHTRAKSVSPDKEWLDQENKLWDEFEPEYNTDPIPDLEPEAEKSMPDLCEFKPSEPTNDRFFA